MVSHMSNKVQVGDVINIPAGVTVTTKIPKHFVYSNHVGDFSVTKTDVAIDGWLLYLVGNYIVTDARMTGGGFGHGINDVYPDGHHVTAKKVDSKIEISFYQSGSFTNVIREVEVIGRAVVNWSVQK